MRHARSNGRPGSVVCVGCKLVACSPVPEPDTHRAGFVPLRTDGIAWTRWRWTKGGEICNVTRQSMDAADFWADLKGRARGKSTQWVFTWRPAETMAALGLWQLLDSGELVLQDEAPQHHDQAGARKRPAWSGFLVADQTVWIAILRWKKSKSTITIVGLENYRYTAPARASSASCQCEAAVACVKDYERLRSTYELGAWRLSISGQALYAFRYKRMTHPFEHHQHGPTQDLEREAYYGGRCECYEIGPAQQQLYQLDINSAYTACAADALVPVKLLLHRGKTTLRELEFLLSRYCVLARVEVETDVPLYPKRIKDPEPLVVYPIGRFKTALAGPELVQGLRRDHIRAVETVTLYRGAHALRQWATEMYAARQAEADALRHASVGPLKALLVSLYGRLAMEGRRWKHRPEVSSDWRWDSFWTHTKPATSWRVIAGRVFSQEKTGFGKDTFPAAGAWITSLARVMLWQLMERAGRENVAYADTDSLWTNTRGYERLRADGLIDSGVLGRLKEVGRYRDVEFFGVKHYMAGGQLTCAGLPSEIARLPAARHVWTETESFASALARKNPPIARLVRRVMSKAKVYKHGIVHQDGSVTPLVFIDNKLSLPDMERRGGKDNPYALASHHADSEPF